ncbi:MAG: hypothetical protein K9J82_15480 [Methylotenera sp.]|jgi:hypothetical protein|nr:hypothetical protein [Methylotenera sp.]
MSSRVVRAEAGLNHAESHFVRTRYGVEFDARERWWLIDGKRGIDVESLRSLVAPSLRPGLVATLRYAAQKYSWSTLAQYRAALKSFQKECFPSRKIAAWTIEDIRRYRAKLIAEFGCEDYLCHLRSLLVKWHSGRQPGVTDSLIASLGEMRLKLHQTGRAVRAMDPDSGPLTPEESHSLLSGLFDAAEAGKLSLSSFSLAYLHVSTGRRPIQSASLKCKDVIQTFGDAEPGFPSGQPIYLLAVPRAKQRGHTLRETRRAIDLTASNFQVFSAQRDDVQRIFQGMLDEAGWQLQLVDLRALLGELPLYPSWRSVTEALELASQMRRAGHHGKALEALSLDAQGMAWHRSASTQSDRISAVCDSVGAKGRNGQPLRIGATRLRHTKGTDLAREGLSSHLIAWLLDHSTSRSADIYVDNLPEHAAEIDRAVSKSPTLQRFAEAFRGTLVDSEEDAIGGSDPEQSRLAYRGKGAATCGHLKQCGLDGGVPHACYTCSHFQPWLDGPHEQFLSDLQAERAHVVAELGVESPIAKRRDKLIAAVENVVHLCWARRSELETAGGQA